MLLNHKLLSKLLLLCSFILILFSSLVFPHRAKASVIFENNFNDITINPQWLISNYALEDTGSISTYSELTTSLLTTELKFFGAGSVSVIRLDNQYVGWLGQSFMTANPVVLQTPSVYTLETKVRFENITTQAQSHLTFEFNDNNRIVFNIGKAANNNIIVGESQLQFDENNNWRCVGSPDKNENFSGCVAESFNINLGQTYPLKIVFDTESKLVTSYVDGLAVNQGHYLGVLSNFNVGIAATVREPGDTIDVRFDDFKLTVEGDDQSNILNVPDLKQFDTPWGTQEYDFASSWYPSNPSIARWGCAMTSAAMVLNYHGSTTNPEQLNIWLKDNNGYTRNGAVLWPAVSRFSLLDPNTPSLEFSYNNYSDELFKNEIENNQPPILKLLNNTYGGNHFIAGKGFDDNNIFVNDPGSATNETLAQANSYWGDTVKLGIFVPSNTNLSYIVLNVDSDFDIKVYDPSEVEIEDEEYYFQEGPMLDPDNPDEISGVEILNAFYFPKPESGLYKVEITGSGNFQLDSYLYNPEGEVELDNHSDNLENGETASFYIYYTDGIQSMFPADPYLAFGSLLDSVHLAFENSLINDEDLYNSLSSLIRNAARQHEKGKTFSPKILLNVALDKVNRFTPELIEENYALLLQNQLQLLINSI